MLTHSQSEEIVVASGDLASSMEKKAIRVLHVDDDASIQEISKMMLLDIDDSFLIDNACCVNEAFEKMKDNQYDAVVSDYEMPHKNGLDFLKELRELGGDIGFILFTGKGREEVAVKALNLGADRYLDKNGSPEAVYNELAHAIKNIVERKKSRQSLRMSESKYRLLVEKSLQGIMIAQNAPLRIAFANAAMGKMLGYTPEEFTSLSPAEVAALVHHEDRTVFFSRFRNRLEGKEADNNYEFRAVRKDGSILWMEAFSSEIEYNGHPAVQAVFLDIDERKKSEDVVKKSEARYRDLANFLPEIVFETDLSGKITFFSQNGFEISGFTPEDLEKGMNMLQFVVPQDRERARENIRRRMAGEKSDSNEYMLLKRNSDTYPVVVKTAPIISENRIIGLRGLVVDISERKNAEQILMESEERLRTYLDSVHSGILLIDPATHVILDANAATKKMFDASQKSIVGSTCHKVVCLAEKGRCPITDLGQTVDHSERTFVKANGKTLPIIKTVTPITLKDRKLLLESFVDITELKQTKISLESSEKKYLELANSLPEIVFEADDKGLLTFVNMRSSEITGYSNDEIKQMNILQFLVPEDRQSAKENIQRLTQGDKTVGNEYTVARKDGTTFPAIIFTERIIPPYGSSSGLRGIIVDIAQTKKNNAELKALAEKLRVVGSLTRHDVGNKLMVAKSNLYLLKKRIGDNPDLVKYLDNIDFALASSDEIFEFSRLYERVGVEKPSRENVFECFNQAAALKPNLGSIKVVNECQGLVVVADLVLKQLFYNFIDNSLKHGEKVTQIRLHWAEDVDGVKLFYEDNGVGILEANKSKLFESGFTTGKGSGHGLYLVKKMMDVYGWTITEEGEPGKGAKFIMTIPKLNKNGKENYQILT